MSKKNWISVKRGLSEDPKHRKAMGEAVWLYLHIIDAADWEKGIVYDWRDADISNDMSLNQRTVRDWRQRLQDAGYIRCEQCQHSLDIIIHNWTDPRSYSGKVLNKKQGDTNMSPSEVEGDTQGDTQGIQESRANPTSFIESTSTSTSHESPSKEKTKNIKIDSLEWMIAAGTDKEELSRVLGKEQREKETAAMFERLMGYNPLPWWSDHKLKSLLDFLLTKTPEEIGMFATWSKNKYSSLSPAKARQNPNLVIECWPQALAQPETALEWRTL